MKTMIYTTLGSGDETIKRMTLDENYDTYRPTKGIAYHFLITVVRNEWLWKIAVLVYETMMSRDCHSHPMVSKNKEQFRQFLPKEYQGQDCAIVDIEQIDGIVIVEPLEILTNAT